MKTISSLLATQLGQPVQRPAVLVEVGFTTVLRMTSASAITWDSRSWTAADIQVQDLQVGALVISGSVLIGNTDGAIGAAMLAETVRDRAVRIYGYDAAEPTEVVWICDAVGAGGEIGERWGRIELRHRAQSRGSPRALVGPETGFNTMLPAGSVIRINGIDLVLNRQT